MAGKDRQQIHSPGNYLANKDLHQTHLSENYLPTKERQKIHSPGNYMANKDLQQNNSSGNYLSVRDLTKTHPPGNYFTTKDCTNSSLFPQSESYLSSVLTPSSTVDSGVDSPDVYHERHSNQVTLYNHQKIICCVRVCSIIIVSHILMVITSTFIKITYRFFTRSFLDIRRSIYVR